MSQGWEEVKLKTRLLLPRSDLGAEQVSYVSFLPQEHQAGTCFLVCHLFFLVWGTS